MAELNPKDIKFWTFLPQSIKIQAIQKDGVPVTDVLVTGWFSFSTVTYEQVIEGGGYEPMMNTDVITPAGEPVTLRLGASYFKGKSPEQVCAKDVTDALAELFKAPFNEVPMAPKEPKTALAPSKRNKK